MTAISVALLAYVNELTKGPIAEANAKTLNDTLKQVLPEFTNNPVGEKRHDLSARKTERKWWTSSFIRQKRRGMGRFGC